MILFVLLILSITLYLRYRSVFGRRIELADKFSGPPLVPILGNALLLTRKRPEEVMDFLVDIVKQFGGFFPVWVGPFHLAFFVTNPKDVEFILSSTKHIKKSNLYDALVPWLGDGLLLSDGQKWNSRRKILTPAFHFNILEDFLRVFHKNTCVMRDLLLNNEVPVNEDRIVDLYPFINGCTLDIICETAMGIELGSQTNQDLPYSKAVVRISEILWKRWTEKMWMRNDLLFKWFGFGVYREHQACLRTLHAFTDNIIKQRRAKVEREGEVNDGGNFCLFFSL